MCKFRWRLYSKKPNEVTLCVNSADMRGVGRGYGHLQHDMLHLGPSMPHASAQRNKSPPHTSSPIISAMGGEPIGLSGHAGQKKVPSIAWRVSQTQLATASTIA